MACWVEGVANRGPAAARCIGLKGMAAWEEQMSPGIAAHGGRTGRAEGQIYIMHRGTAGVSTPYVSRGEQCRCLSSRQRNMMMREVGE